MVILYIEEVVNTLIDNEILIQKGTNENYQTLDDADIPSSINGVLLLQGLIG